MALMICIINSCKKNLKRHKKQMENLVINFIITASSSGASFFARAEASAKRVTGDTPQGTMGRVQTAGFARTSREASGYEAVIIIFNSYNALTLKVR